MIIKGPKSSIEVPKVKFVDDNSINYTNIHEDVYNELDKSITDEDSVFDENVFDDVMERLRNVKIKNKQDFDNQLERVLTVTK